MVYIHQQGASGKLFAAVDPRLQSVANEAAKAGCGFKVTTGYRSSKEQQAKFEAGLSKAKPGQSPHNQKPARAFDFIPHPFTGWNDIASFRRCARAFIDAGKRLNIPVTWGRDWDGDGDETDQKLMDGPHIELKGWRNK